MQNCTGSCRQYNKVKRKKYRRERGRGRKKEGKGRREGKTDWEG
jgi:hypothetical protein